MHTELILDIRTTLIIRGKIETWKMKYFEPIENTIKDKDKTHFFYLVSDHEILFSQKIDFF